MTLSEESAEYVEVETNFNRSISGYFSSLRRVRQIEKIQNSFLYAHYQLKKAHKRSLHGWVHERTLYHGTKACNVDSICKINLTGVKWAITVLDSASSVEEVFSPSAKYASDYPRGAKICLMASHACREGSGSFPMCGCPRFGHTSCAA
ncbi:hypothetical protein JTB14_030374 [Gonioctena quinquepunctata]|nr:hypothetical protein JTB14_030374 [Gonioctena quinquepunctata]